MSTSSMPLEAFAKGRTFYLAVVAVACFAAPVGAAPEAELWPYWQAHDAGSRQSVDHSRWADFLDRYLVEGGDGINRIRYGAVSDADRRSLDAYIEQLAGITVTGLDRDRQFAYWVNLYNALTVKVVLDHYPVDSIRDIDISPGWFSSGPWGKELVTVEGKALSLDDIEHRILRPIWQDPRIHYAVNCAAMGCPNLMDRPYRAQDLDDCLDRQARRYVNHPRGFRFEDGDVIASKIYDWYQADFGNSEAGVIEHMMPYAEPGLEARLREIDGIDDYEYDWSLNDAGSPE